MMMRIVAGKWGGRKLTAPNGEVTHPMGERVRSALFNIIGYRLNGSQVLDVFAGTGSIGLEALSRGAKRATFVESDKLAFSYLKKNVASLEAEDETELSKVSLGAWLNTYKGPKFDYIFADPPYKYLQEFLVDRLHKVLKPEGVLVLSNPTRRESRLINFEEIDKRIYGEAKLIFYKLKNRD